MLSLALGHRPRNRPTTMPFDRRQRVNLAHFHINYPDCVLEVAIALTYLALRGPRANDFSSSISALTSRCASSVPYGPTSSFGRVAAYLLPKQRRSVGSCVSDMLDIRPPHRIALDMFISRGHIPLATSFCPTLRSSMWQCMSFALHLSTSLFILLIVSSRRILPSRDAVPVGSQNTMQPRHTPPRCHQAPFLTPSSARTTRRTSVFALAGRTIRGSRKSQSEASG